MAVPRQPAGGPETRSPATMSVAGLGASGQDGQQPSPGSGTRSGATTYFPVR